MCQSWSLEALAEPEMIGCGKGGERGQPCVVSPSEGTWIKSSPVKSVIGFSSPKQGQLNCAQGQTNHAADVAFKGKFCFITG